MKRNIWQLLSVCALVAVPLAGCKDESPPAVAPTVVKPVAVTKQVDPYTRLSDEPAVITEMVQTKWFNDPPPKRKKEVLVLQSSSNSFEGSSSPSIVQDDVAPNKDCAHLDQTILATQRAMNTDEMNFEEAQKKLTEAREMAIMQGRGGTARDLANTISGNLMDWQNRSRNWQDKLSKLRALQSNCSR